MTKNKTKNIRESLSILTEIYETAYEAFHDGLNFDDIDDVGRIVSLLYDISKKTDDITKECKKLTDEQIDNILKDFMLEIKEILILIRDERN